MLKWAYRYRGGITLFEAAEPKSWWELYHIARQMRSGFQTYMMHNGAWISVL